MHELLLVSQSPRRREILQQAGFKFRADTVKVSEIINENLNLEDAIKDLARTKAQAYLNQQDGLKGQEILILTADTVVALGDQILGKPKDQEEARTFLRNLSGNVHTVVTAFCLYDGKTGEFHLDFDRTEVRFKSLTDKTISDYIATGEPFDKAGAYGIQGLGRELVESFHGSFENVVGLPIQRLQRLLQQQGFDVYREPT